MAGHESKKAIYYALAANFGIAVAKGVATFITMSGSMLAVPDVKWSFIKPDIS